MSVDVTRDSPAWQPLTEEAEEAVTEALRELALWLYRRLEADYDHLTSDGPSRRGSSSTRIRSRKEGGGSGNGGQDAKFI